MDTKQELRRVDVVEGGQSGKECATNGLGLSLASRRGLERGDGLSDGDLGRVWYIGTVNVRFDSIGLACRSRLAGQLEGFIHSRAFRFG